MEGEGTYSLSLRLVFIRHLVYTTETPVGYLEAITTTASPTTYEELHRRQVCQLYEQTLDIICFVGHHPLALEDG